MAPSYAYDYRPAPPYQSRRQDSYSRSHTNFDPQHTRHDAPRELSSSRDRRRSLTSMSSPRDRGFYYSQAPRGHPPSQPVPVPSSFLGSTYRSRRRWPPSPSVEDEAVSVARESASSVADESADEEVCERGVIDQDPIMIELEQPMMLGDNSERRFVLVSDEAISNPRTRNSFRSERKTPTLKTNVNNLPDFRQRERTPYAFSKSYNSPDTGSNRSSAEYFLSPESITPSTSMPFRSYSRSDEGSDGKRLSQSSRAPSSNRHDSFASSGSRTLKDNFDGSDVSDSEAANLRSRRAPRGYSFNTATLPKEDMGTSVTDFASKEPHRSLRESIIKGEGIKVGRSGERSSSLNSSARSRPENTRTSSSSNLPDTGSPRVSFANARSFQESSGYSSTVRDSDSSSSPTPERWPPSPPRSPRLKPTSGLEVPKPELPQRPASRASQRAPSPLAKTSTFPLSFSPREANADFRSSYPPATKDGSRKSPFNSSVDSNSQPVPARTARPRIDVPNLLPYPEDSPLMPSEEFYQFNHNSPKSAGANSRLSRENPLMGTSPKSEFVHRQSPRPELKSRHTAEGVPKSQSSSTRPASSALRRVETASPAPPIKSRKLPPCPRPDYTSRYDFWYTLYGMPTLNICPDCLDNIVAGTPFIKYFERQMRRHPDEKTRCDFSAHWIRIAWVLTLERELSNLNLIYEVAEIMASEQECPGNRESYRSWYVLPADYHSSTEKLPPFHICSFDMRIVEALLPSFRGFFERARPPLASSPTDSNSHEKRLCSLRIQSPHFTTFFDALVAADDDAQYRSAMQRRSGGGSSPLDPDLRPFLDIVRDRLSSRSSSPITQSNDGSIGSTSKNKSSTSRRECPRDDVLVLDAPWHTIPGLPEFTVCEACFAEVVYPDIAAGSPLAAKMSSSARPVPAITIDSRSGGGTTVVEGHSCQLYSPRMRHVWRCAVQDEDLGYLVRKARERRKVETVLTARYKGLMRRVEAKGGFAAMEGSVEAEQLKAKIRDVLTDWKNWE